MLILSNTTPSGLKNVNEIRGTAISGIRLKTEPPLINYFAIIVYKSKEKNTAPQEAQLNQTEETPSKTMEEQSPVLVIMTINRLKK